MFELHERSGARLLKYRTASKVEGVRSDDGAVRRAMSRTRTALASGKDFMRGDRKGSASCRRITDSIRIHRAVRLSLVDRELQYSYKQEKIVVGLG
jgi:hypothetical protein